MVIPFELRRYFTIGFIIVVVLAVVGSSTVVGYTLLTRANSAPAATVPNNKLSPPAPTPSSSPSAAPKIAAPKPIAPIAPPATPNSSVNGWTVTGGGNVDIIPSFSADYKNLLVDFQSFSLFQINSINYTLSYTADPGVTRLVKGSVNPALDQTVQTNSKPTIRKTIVLGTCSGVNCVYDTNTRNYILTNLIKSNNGLTVNLKTLTLSGSASASAGP